jgi:V/A-type H+-transporting ATPase subunit C
MWSRLLGEGTLDLLVDAKDLEGQVRVLSGTAYKDCVEEEIVRGTGVDTIDRALRAHLGDTVSLVLDLLPESGIGKAKAVLARWDIHDIKTVVRGVHSRSSPADIIDSLMPAASLSDPELLDLAQAEDVKQVIDIMATWHLPYAEPLTAAMPEYRRTGSPAPLELAVDRWFFSKALDRLKHGCKRDCRTVRGVFGVMVDVQNLCTVFRLIGAELSNEEIEGYYLDGGMDIDRVLFDQLATATDVDGVIDALRRTPYGAPLESSAVLYLKEGTISVLERSLEDLLTREMLRLRKPDPLGIGVSLAYLWAKQNEVSNIRIAVAGKAVGLPEDRLRREFILV